MTCSMQGPSRLNWLNSREAPVSLWESSGAVGFLPAALAGGGMVQYLIQRSPRKVPWTVSFLGWWMSLNFYGGLQQIRAR